MPIISDDDQRTSAMAVRVVRLVFTADSRTEKLCVLLTASNSHHCIARTCLIQPVIDVSREMNTTLIPYFFNQRPRLLFFSLLLLCGYSFIPKFSVAAPLMQ